MLDLASKRGDSMAVIHDVHQGKCGAVDSSAMRMTDVLHVEIMCQRMNQTNSLSSLVFRHDDLAGQLSKCFLTFGEGRHGWLFLPLRSTFLLPHSVTEV